MIQCCEARRLVWQFLNVAESLARAGGFLNVWREYLDKYLLVIKTWFLGLMLQASRGGRKKVMSKENGPKLSGSHSCMFHKEILDRWLRRKTWRFFLSAVKQWILFSGKVLAIFLIWTRLFWCEVVDSQWGNCDVTIRTEASRNRIIEILFVRKRMLLVGYSMHLFYYMVFFRSSCLRKWKLTQL